MAANLFSVIRPSAILTLAFFGLSGISGAQTYTWNNASPNNARWNDEANWIPDDSYPNGVNVEADLYVEYTRNPAVINFSGYPSIGKLIVGNAGGSQSTVLFTGASKDLRLNMKASNGVATIIKESSNLVEFQRRVIFDSETIITVNGGELRFNGSQFNTLSGSGNLVFEGKGGVTTLIGSKPDFSTEFAGEITVRNHGTLLISGNLAASTLAPTATISVEDTGVLGGTSVVERPTLIQSGGLLLTGTPAIMTYSAGLELKSGSKFSFALFSDTTAKRGEPGGVAGVDVKGKALSIGNGAIFNIVFNGEDSKVDFSSAFWRSEQKWLVFSNEVAPDVAPGIFVLGDVSADSKGAPFKVTGGSFSFLQDGNNIYLVYSASSSGR